MRKNSSAPTAVRVAGRVALQNTYSTEPPVDRPTIANVKERDLVPAPVERHIFVAYPWRRGERDNRYEFAQNRHADNDGAGDIARSRQSASSALIKEKLSISTWDYNCSLAHHEAV